MEPFGDLTFEEAQDAYREQISALNDAGCDLLVIETMLNIDELKAALRASKEVSDLPVLATMSFGVSGKTIYGTSAADAARIITDEGADAVGANCSLGPDLMLTVIESIAANTHLPVIAKPNAGLPNLEGTYELSADAFAGQAARLADAGASLIGGCCGTSPEYIRKLAALIDR